MKTRLSLILSFIFMILVPAVMAGVADSPQSLVDIAHHYFDLQSSMGASEFDVSIVLLGKLFGPIGPFFPWGSNTLLSTLIQYFNLGVLCFASAVISSTVLTHVTNTSGKADEAWKQTSMSKLLVRTGLSITSLVPLQTGYSALQVMLMWIVIQSVHVADGIWNLTQSSLKEYRSLVTQVAGEEQQSSTDASTQSSQATLIKAVLPLSSSLVKSQLCYYRNLAKIAADKSKLNALTAHTLPVSATGSSNDPQIIWTHPSSQSAGGVKYNFGTGKSSLPDCGAYTLGAPIKGIKPEDSFSAFQALFFQADRLAHSIWTTEFKPKFSGSMADQLQGLCQVASQCQINDVQTPEAWVSSLVKDKPGIPHCQDKQYCCSSSTAKSCYNSSDLSSISLGYALQMQAFYNPPTSDTQADQDQQLGKGGWITAGNYYYELAQSAANDSDKDFAGLITKAISHSELKTQDIYLKGMYGYVDNYLDKSVKQQLNKTPSNTDSGTLVNNLYAAVSRFMPDGGFDFSSNNSDEHWKDVPVFAKKPWNNVSTFGDAFWCGIGFPGDRTCTVSTANDSFWKTPTGFALNPKNLFADSYDPQLSNKAINSDIQLYLAKLAQSWVNIYTHKSQAQDNNGDFEAVFQDPIAMLQNFGESLILNNINFISHLTQDVVLTNFQTQFHYFMLQQTYAGITMASSKVADGLIWVGNKILLYGGFFAFLGFIPKVAGAAVLSVANAYAVKSTAISMNYNLEIYQKFMYIPTAVAAGVPLFATGVVMAYFVPLLPFLIFTLTAIGWFIMVIEAVLAAPLVAVGLTHPVGHEFLGRAQQAMMLLVSIFVRPPLILLGFLLGIVLCFVGTQLINQLMAHVILTLLTKAAGSSDLTKASTSVGAFILYLLMIWAYVMAMMRLVNQSFGLVYVLPNYICRWIGVPKDDSGEAMHLDAIESDMHGLGDQLSSGSSGVVEGQTEKRLM